MKKIILGLLIIISLVSQAQMIRTEHKEIIFGSTINYVLYQPKVPSDCWLIFLHGAGERGPIDGSKLDLVDRHGPPKHAKAGFEYPFNIIAPQCVTSFAQIKHIMAAFVKLKHKARVIYVTGLSLGGGGTWDMKQNDIFGIVDGIAPICGGGSPVTINGVKVPFTELIKKWPQVNGWAFHGDNDGTVSYKQSTSAVDAYNSTHTNIFKITIYPGVGHNSWDKAYSITPGQDELYQWLKDQFESYPKESKPFDIEKFKIRLDSLVNSYLQK